MHMDVHNKHKGSAMKRLIISAMIVCTAAPAFAGDIGVALSDRDQQAFLAAPGVMSQCISGMVFSNDIGACRDVAGFLISLKKRVEGMQEAAKAASQVTVPTSENPTR